MPRGGYARPRAHVSRDLRRLMAVAVDREAEVKLVAAREDEVDVGDEWEVLATEFAVDRVALELRKRGRQMRQQPINLAEILADLRAVVARWRPHVDDAAPRQEWKCLLGAWRGDRLNGCGRSFAGAPLRPSALCGLAALLASNLAARGTR